MTLHQIMFIISSGAPLGAVKIIKVFKTAKK